MLHGFVCESKNQARQLTFALAAAFKEYGKKVSEDGGEMKKRFAVDLRTPEEMSKESDEETEA